MVKMHAFAIAHFARNSNAHATSVFHVCFIRGGQQLACNLCMWVVSGGIVVGGAEPSIAVGGGSQAYCAAPQFAGRSEGNGSRAMSMAALG